MKRKLLAVFSLLAIVFVLASCGAKTFTVTFESNQGSVVETITGVKSGEKISKPADPTRLGFDFKGWYKEAALTTEWKFDVDLVVNDMTLYAKWETKAVVSDKVKVTFNLGYTGSTAPRVEEIDKGTKVSKPTDPTRDDFEFLGWFVGDSETAFDFNQAVLADVILTAQWRTTKTIYKVTLDLGYDNLTDVKDVIDGENLEVADPTRAGHIFVGWTLNGDAFDLETTPITGATTLVATWIVDSGLEGTVIYNASQLAELFLTGGDGSYWLANDIDMSSVDYKGSVGSGDSAVTFSGTLNGNGKRILNLNVETENNKTAAMFGILNGATIKNLVITRSSIVVPGEGAGFIAVYGYGGTTFEDITFINVSTDSTGSYAGLLYADNQNNPSDDPVIVKNIVVSNDDNNEINAGRYAGVLIGHVRTKQRIQVENVFIRTNVNISGASTAAAIIGRIQSAEASVSVNGAYVEGDIFATNYVGALIGEANVAITLDFNNIVLNNLRVHTSGSTVGLLVGRTHNDLVINTLNVVHTDTVKVFSHTTTEVAILESQSTLTTLTETWFNDSDLDKEFFSFENGNLGHKVDLGPKVAETLTIGRNSYNPLFVKGIDTELDLSQLEVAVSYSDGTSEIIDLNDLVINKDDFNPEVTGSYEIHISFDGLEGLIIINVVEIDRLEVHTYDVSHLYLADQTPDLSKIVVHAILADDSILILDNDTVDVAVAATTVGEQEVTVTFREDYQTTFNLTFVEEALVAVDNVVTVVVDKDFEGVSGSVVEGIVYVKSVKEAINLIEKSQLDSEVIKRIEIKDGLYTEKLRIATPNVHMIGERQDGTIIDYGVASSDKQPNGADWGTQGSASVTVASGAKGFIATNLTFSNSFDYNNSTIANKQAVALVNEADQAIYYKVSFKGYQDTLYAKNGRQWYLDVYVEGIVDYIFGNGGPVFFEASEIMTLQREGTNANAVIAAPKGIASDNSVLEYGYVFFNNNFTAPETMTSGIDLGRPWGPDAAVAYINNQFNEHMSEVGWIDMSGNKAVDARFFEYNNTIEDTPYQSTVGTALTEAQAALYASKKVVFGKVNGAFTFADEWDYAAQLQHVAPELVATVTFDYDNGETDLEVVVFKGETVDALADPAKLGFSFDGWFVSEQAFDFDQAVTEDLLVVAKWGALDNPVTVTFKDGETVLAEIIINEGDLVTAIADPEKLGFVFDGWLLDGEAFDFDTQVAEDMVLTAKWAEYVPEGTAISTPEELIAVITGQISSGTMYYLANDIDMAGENVTHNPGAEFSGIFDGNFKTIRNLTYSGEGRLGLFRSLKGATVKNLALENFDILSLDDRAGILAAEIISSYTVIENISISNSKVSGNNKDNAAGGLVAYINAPASIKNISITGTEISNSGDIAIGLGGITGRVNAVGVTMTDIFLDVKIIGTKRVGGVIGVLHGNTQDLELERIVVISRLKGDDLTASVIGKADGKNVNIILKDIVTISTYLEGTQGALGIYLGDGNRSVITLDNLNVYVDGVTPSQNNGLSADDLIPNIYDVYNATWWNKLPAITENALWELNSDLGIYALKSADLSHLVKPQSVTVTLDLGYGDNQEEVILPLGDKLAELANPTREDYTFMGWTLDGVAYDFDAVVLENITLVANWELITVADVTDEAELRAALENSNIREINLVNDIVLEDKLVLLRNDVTINGDDFRLVLTEVAGWNGDYILHVYKAIGVVINNVVFEGGDAALLVNGAEVIVENITLNNHEFGGIEISQGTNVTEVPKLEVMGTLNSNLYELPFIWIDGKTTNDGWVVLPEGTELVSASYTEEDKEQVWFINETVDELAPVLVSKSLEVVDGKVVLTVHATDEYLYSLEIDHNLSLPEFTVYASEQDPYGEQEEAFAALGVTVTYLDGVWTITFDGDALEAIKALNKFNMHMVIEDRAGNAFGSMNPTSPENTVSINIYEVKFINDGEETSFRIFENHKVSAIDAGTKEGYTFLGWTLNDVAYEFDAVVTGNITLVANWELITVLDVTNEAELRSALDNVNIREINLVNDILLDAKLLLLRSDVTINGNGHKLSLVPVVGWQGDYILHVYKATDVVIKDLVFDGGDAALLVNGSEVAIENITLNNPEFGGVEVSVGSNVDTVPQLTVSGTLESNLYALPFIWIDGKTTNDGWVVLPEGTELVSASYTEEGKEQVWFINETVDELAPVLESKSLEVVDGKVVLTVHATDEYLYSLEIDHSLDVNEFTVYALELDPYGGQEEAFAALGVTVTYADGVWIITFDGESLDLIKVLDKFNIYMVITDKAGNTFGSMSPTTSENTVSIDIHTINFINESETESIKFFDGELITFPEFVKEGFTLDGWFTDEEGTIRFEEEVALESVTLYAKFTQRVIEIYTADGLNPYFTATNDTAKDGTFTIEGLEITIGLKLNSGGKLSFTTGKANAKVRIYILARKVADIEGGRMKVTGDGFSEIRHIKDILLTESTLGFTEITLGSAGTYTIARDNKELSLYYVEVIE